MEIDIFDLSRSEWEKIIDDWIFNEETRKMLKRRLLDGICYEQLAEEFGLSTVAVYKRIAKAKKELFKRVDRLTQIW